MRAEALRLLCGVVNAPAFNEYRPCLCELRELVAREAGRTEEARNECRHRDGAGAGADVDGQCAAVATELHLIHQLARALAAFP